LKKQKNLEKRKLPKYLIIIIIVFFLSFYLSYRFDIGGQLISVVEQTTTTSTTTTTVKPKLKVLVSNVVETTTTLMTTNKTTTTTSIIIKTTTTTTKSYKSSGGGGSSKTTTTIPKPVAKIIINEIMYNPPGSDEGNEWIEIYNNDTIDCDISDWNLFESGTNHRLTLQQGSMTIPVGIYAIITDNATNFLINHPNFNGTIIKSSFSLSNDGEYVALKDYSLNVVDDITYNSSYGGDGNNKTLERTGNDWCENLVDGGTPGFVNSVLTCAITTTTSTTTTTETTMTTELTTTIETTTPSTTTTITTTSTTSTTTTTETTTTSSTSTTTTTIPIIADHVVISEVYYDPLNETCSEFVELYNPKNEDVNISDWGIATPTSPNDATIPSNSFIKSYGFYLITDGCWYTGRDNSTWSGFDHNETITLRNDDGWIILKNNLGTTVDKVGWGNATNYEGNQTVDVDQSKSLERKPGYLNSTTGNGRDSDNNLEDFIIRDTPEPQNSSFVEI
jgi:hypothetical protein